MDLVVDTRFENGYTVVTPRGEVDIATVDVFRGVLAELFIQGRVDVLVDLDGTTFFDSLGFGALVAARRKAQVFNGSLGIVCSNARMLSLFEITGLDRVFSITSSVEAQPQVVRPLRADPTDPAGS